MKFKKQIEYTLLTDAFADRLSDQITDLLLKGWTLYGQPMVVHNGSTTEYSQALVLLEDH